MVASVGVHTVPCAAIARSAAASKYAPCSTESTPASAAARTVAAPLACAITEKPSPCAMCIISAMVSSGSGALVITP